VFLHRVASQHVTSAARPGQVAMMVAQTLCKTLASLGQDILPLILLLGALGSALQRNRRQGLITTLRRATRPLRSMA